MIKCPKCGEEYSYGRKIYHECEYNSIFSGALFEKDRKKYEWNYLSASHAKPIKIDENIFNTCLNCKNYRSIKILMGK